MYKNFFYHRGDNQCYIWDDVDGLVKFPYERYAYKLDSKGEFKTLNGLSVCKVKTWDIESEKNGTLFEYDVPISTRVLIDNYFESDQPSTNHKIFFYDIEVEKADKHSTPKDASNTITSIAYYIDGNYTCLLLDRAGNLKNSIRSTSVTGLDEKIDVNLVVFSDERDLLLDFVKRWIKISPDIVVGWNSEVYDLPYTYNRIKNVLNKKVADRLSPIEIVYTRDINKNDIGVTIAGVSGLDYMQMYKNFTYSEESSYSLEAISQKELKRGKVKYEGSLDDLYSTDIDKFIEYNVNDVELMVALDKKLNFIQTAIGICHAGHVPYEDYQFSSKYLEGAALTYCKRKGLVANGSKKELFIIELPKQDAIVKKGKQYLSIQSVKEIKDKTKVFIINDDDEYELIGIYFNKHQKKKSTLLYLVSDRPQGAIVKKPKIGLYDYIIDLDLTSLYPSLIRSFNISPEKIYGKVDNWNETDFIKKVTKTYEVKVYSTLEEQLLGNDEKILNIPHSDFWNYIVNNQLCITSNGVLFKNDTQGFLPEILTEWFNERKRLSGLAEEYGKAGDVDKHRYYDQQQLIQKILLNSFYGVLLLPSFRFYNKDIGEAVTISGQSVITYSMKVANAFCNSTAKTENIDYVTYSDTDSLFLNIYSIINPNNEELSTDVLVNRTLNFAQEIQAYINKSYDAYSIRLHNSKNHFLNIKQEMIAKKGFFGQAKKRYALWVINNKGIPCDKLEIKGFDTVRSSFPKSFRVSQREIIIDILHGVNKDTLNNKIIDFYAAYKKKPISEVLLPSSVKEISKYEDITKGVPIHINSAKNYNLLIDLFKVTNIPKIVNGDKVLYGYMQINPYGFETLAIKNMEENPEEITNFIAKFIDRNKIFEKTYLSKMERIWNDLGWGKIQLNNNDFF